MYPILNEQRNAKEYSQCVWHAGIMKQNAADGVDAFCPMADAGRVPDNENSTIRLTKVLKAHDDTKGKLRIYRNYS